jgi:hypothetical protein
MELFSNAGGKKPGLSSFISPDSIKYSHPAIRVEVKIPAKGVAKMWE